VFVQDQAGKFAPRIVRLGASNYDYSEVLSGLKEGDKVATLNVGMLQQKRDQQNDRFRSMTGSGVPGMGAPAGGGAGAGGARGAGGGGNGGGGGGARPQGGGGR
jgi:Cu(I)/Ag(I) efflux system membrane fusion protein